MKVTFVWIITVVYIAPLQGNILRSESKRITSGTMRWFHEYNCYLQSYCM